MSLKKDFEFQELYRGKLGLKYHVPAGLIENRILQFEGILPTITRKVVAFPIRADVNTRIGFTFGFLCGWDDAMRSTEGKHHE